jgi:hypothetical protein
MTRRIAPPNRVLAGLLTLCLSACVEITGDDDNGDSAADGSGDDGDDDDSGGGGGGGNPPDSAQVESCQGSCDSLLFFDCLNADDHANCYAVCPERTNADIDLFDACVSNTLPECSDCYDNLLGAPVVGGEGDDGGSVTGTCVDACNEWIGAGCEALGEAGSCEEFCASIPETLHDFVVECVDARVGCTLPEECTFESDGSVGGG